MPVRSLPARVVAACAGALALLAGAPAGPAVAAPAGRPCPDQPDFRCATLRVPLDRSGATPGTVALRYAVEARGPRPVLVELSGGPGQPSVDAAGSLALSVQPALHRYRVAVLDQRGTGRSGALSCPALQRLRSLDPVSPATVAACAQDIGPRRAFYTTADSVLDLEDLRQALGVARIALKGTSYGTYVALQYARAFPEHVDRLILDSIVGPDRPDGLGLDVLGGLPRVLRELCARGACRGVTADPVADVGALVGRLAQGPLAGTTYDAGGHRHATAYRSAEELLGLLIEGDLNPYLQAALPAAVAAARAGDPAALLRLRRIAQGTRTRLADLSFGLLVTTGCEDAALPYALSAPLEQRQALLERAVAAVDPARYAPFDARTLLDASDAGDCRSWPVEAVRQPFAGPLPDVPALLLSGRADVRTPLENAQATAAQLPHATVVTLRGAGHDVLDGDVTGCSAVALRRFVDGRAVGHPCAGRDNGVDLSPLPPRSLADYAAGSAGRRGRALRAVLDTATDADLAATQAVYAGLEPRGGGLRGGRYAVRDGLGGRLALDRYAFLAGLRVSGTLDLTGDHPAGTVRVRGLVAGTLTLDRRGGARGVLDGRAASLGR